jgi:hypothetical protein
MWRGNPIKTFGCPTLIVNGASANPRLLLYELFSVLMDAGQVGIEHNRYCTRVGVEYRGVDWNSCYSGIS